MKYEPWQYWAVKPEGEAVLETRAKGNLPEMECTKQLVGLISRVYQPGMRILDMGCNVGHYLLALRGLDTNINYVGADAYPIYIEKAKAIFGENERTAFFVKDIMEPIFPDRPFDIVFCCNLIIHLPDFRLPVRNLLESTKGVCFIRTPLGEKTTLVKYVEKQEFDTEGNPLAFRYLNTYDADYFVNYIKDLGWKAKIIEDEFCPEVIADEFTHIKKGAGTRIIDGKQADGNIIYDWKFVEIKR
ncbi:class I SAM-dependent methyltransferase [Chloroflexota bacterium]